MSFTVIGFQIYFQASVSKEVIFVLKIRAECDVVPMAESTGPLSIVTKLDFVFPIFCI